MVKDFKSWSNLKQKLDAKQRRAYFKEREIWWCSIGVNVGEEIDGKSQLFSRPILVLKKLTKNLCIGLPLTTKVKLGSWYAPIFFNEKSTTVILNQIRVLDSRRFTSKICELSRTDFYEVKRKLLNFLS
jgi:mRNA interferase MazF